MALRMVLNDFGSSYETLREKVIKTQLALSRMTTWQMYQEFVPQSMVNLFFATRLSRCGTVSRTTCGKSLTLGSSGGLIQILHLR